MVVTPLAVRSPLGLRAALLQGGWDESLAGTTAAGVAAGAFRITGLDEKSLEALVHFGGRLGLDVVTGPDWAIVSGSRSRLGALARPWSVPEPLGELALQLGLAMPAEPATTWRTARGVLSVDAPILMGILNVTPDSFSDGGRTVDAAAALRHAERLLSDGAGILDVGGESTRPGRTHLVPAEEELRRVLPVVQALVREFPGAAISVDTMKSDVARATLEAGASIINDVTGLRHDPALGRVVAEAGAGLVLMHSRGEPLAIASAEGADYAGDVIGGVTRELRSAMERAMAAGIPLECLVIDPGLGFSKTAEQNMFVADQLEAFLALGRPILVGPSRKRFLGVATGRPVAERDVATAAACALAYERGARLFRVHDVGAARDALAVARAFGGHPPAP